MSKQPTERKRQIVSVATEMFAQRGFEKVTVNDLAKACGITEPAVYRHFKSKEAVYDAVLDSIEVRLESADLFDSLRDEEDVETILRSLALHVINFFGANEDIHRLLLYSTLSDHPKAHHVFDITRGRYVRFLNEQLDRLHATGTILQKNNTITARCFVGMVFDCALGQTLWRPFAEPKYDPAEVVANNVPIYARGLQA
ncbi:TetR family transcriptional regulator [candidate division GN15 bacterium]|nr:TetR family transcriptional regulator [candidate division GN15 bacterium]